ncbi:hypothetical protein V8E54_011810 [Elaphomyces granulatus]
MYTSGFLWIRYLYVWGLSTSVRQAQVSGSNEGRTSPFERTKIPNNKALHSDKDAHICTNQQEFMINPTLETDGQLLMETEYKVTGFLLSNDLDLFQGSPIRIAASIYIHLSDVFFFSFRVLCPSETSSRRVLTSNLQMVSDVSHVQSHLSLEGLDFKDWLREDHERTASDRFDSKHEYAVISSVRSWTLPTSLSQMFGRFPGSLSNMPYIHVDPTHSSRQDCVKNLNSSWLPTTGY